MAFQGNGLRPNFHPRGWQGRLNTSDATYQKTIAALNRQLAQKQHDLDKIIFEYEEFQRNGISESAKANEQLSILQERVNELEARNRDLQATVNDQGREIAIQQGKLYDCNETIKQQEETIQEHNEQIKFLQQQSKPQPLPQPQPQQKVRIFTVEIKSSYKDPKILFDKNPRKAIENQLLGNYIMKMVVVFPGDDKSVTYKDAIRVATSESNYTHHLPVQKTQAKPMSWNQPPEAFFANETKDSELTQLGIDTLRNFYYHTSYNTGLVVPQEGQIVAIFTKPPNPFPDYRYAPDNSGYGFPFILKEQCKHLIHTPFLIKKCHLELDEFRQPKRNRDVRMWF